MDETTTGAEQDPPQVVTCTAWDLMGDHYPLWADDDYRIFVGDGWQSYAEAYNTRNDMICLAYIQPMPDMQLRVVRRYVAPTTPITLRRSAPPTKKESSNG